jgi:hypothetical protein
MRRGSVDAPLLANFGEYPRRSNGNDRAQLDAGQPEDYH